MTIRGLSTTRSDMNVLWLLILNLGAFRIILGSLRRGCFSVVVFICVGFAILVAGLLCYFGFSFFTTCFDSLVLFIITRRNNLNKTKPHRYFTVVHSILIT